LETTSNLNSPVNWSPVAGTLVVVDDYITITLPASPGIQFYRLRKP